MTTWPLQMVKLKAFKKFDNTADALMSAAALVDSKVSKTLKKCAPRVVSVIVGSVLAKGSCQVKPPLEGSS